MIKSVYSGFFIAIDGPNGVGKSTLIRHVKKAMTNIGINVYVTKEPSKTKLGNFVRRTADTVGGESLACLVAADRYHHISNTVIPMLKKGATVITDRYILSSLILQCMDNIETDFVLAINSKTILPNMQIVVRADIDTLKLRLDNRKKLTRFERGQRSSEELFHMEKGKRFLLDMGVPVLDINNTGNLQDNVSLIVKHIVEAKR